MKLEKTNYAGVYLSDKGKYYINFKGLDGVSKRRVTNAKTAKEAKRLLDEKKHEISDIKDGKLSAVNIDRSIDTMDDLSKVFFDLRTTKGNTVDKNRYMKWVSPVIGSVKHPIGLMQMESLQKVIADSKVNGTKKDGKTERDIAPATVNDIMTLLVGMLRWGVKRKLVLYVDGVPSPSPLDVDNERERVLTHDEVVLLLDRLDTKKASLNMREIVRRNRLAVMLGLYTGSRPIHYLNLRAKDIVLDDKGTPVRIMFSALKGAKAYSIPVSEKLKLDLSVALEGGLGRDKLVGDDKLFESGYEAVRKSLGKVLNELFNEGVPTYDVKHRVTLYTLRHSSASFMLEATGDIYLCSKLLGHSSVKTTQRYAKVTDKSLMDGINSF